jgi:tripartite-type tricarboxylate transporter receptor subunit TctC
MKPFHSIASVASALLLFGVLGNALAQDRPKGYPAKPVRILVGNAPGGASDIVTRLVAGKLAERWGSPVIVENVAGAEGMIAVDRVAQAAPDGHTLFAGGSIIEFMAVGKKLSFDLMQTMTPVVQMSTQSYLLVVPNSLPVKTIKELVAYAKVRPGQLNYAGTAPPAHLGHEILNKALGITATHVPYKGAGPALPDLIAGRVQMMFVSTVSGIPQVRNGTLKAIASTGERRLAGMPDLPTVAESGAPDFELTNGYGLWTQAKVAPAILTAVNRDVLAITHSQDVKDKLAAGSSEPQPPHTPAEYRDRAARRIAESAAFIQASGIKL